MSLIINSGYKSLNLYFTPPSNAYNIDDDSTAGDSQLPDTSLRTDVDKLYVYVSTTSGFTPSADTTTGNLAYSGTFQSNLTIDRVQKTPPIGYTGTLPYYEPLADNTQYYVRYAITSKLEPDLIVAQAGQEIASTLDISLEIQGSLTRDPMEIEADIAGNVVFPSLTSAAYNNIIAGSSTTIAGTGFGIYAVGMPVKFPATTGITGISANTLYYIYDITSTTFKIATTYTNAVSSIGITSTGTYTGGAQLATVLDEASNTYTGTFTVYKYSTNITTSNDITFEILDGSGTAPNILPDSITGGVSISINNTNGSSAKGKYTVHGITSLVGTATLRATYTDPANTSRKIVLEKVLNIGKRRPGATASIVELVANPGMIFVERANESGVSPATIVLSATPSAHVTNPDYTWKAQDSNGTTTLVEFNNPAPNQLISSNFPSIKKTSNANEIEVNKAFFSGLTPPQVKTFSVEVESVALNIIVQDTISLYYIKEGSDSVALGFTNENQTVSYDYNGDLLDLTTPLKAQLVVLLGSVQLLPSSLPDRVQSIAFSVDSLNVQGITWNSAWLTTTGAIAGTVEIPRNATNFPSNFTSAQIPLTVTITFKNNSTPVILTKTLYINSSRDGRGGESYWLVNNPKLVIRQKNQQINVSTVTWTAKRSLSGVVSTYLTGYYKVFADGVLQALETPIGGQLIPNIGKYWNQSGVITLRVNQSITTSTVFTCQLYKDSLFQELLDEDDIQVYNEETEGIILFNDNTNHTFTLNTTNQVSTYIGSGTYFSVQQGSELFTVNLPTSNLTYNNTYDSSTGVRTITTSNSLNSKQFYLKSIEFGPGISVSVVNWTTKISGQGTQNLNFLDWWDSASATNKITLDAGITQTYIKFTIEYKRIDGTLGVASSTQKITTTRDALAIIVDVENDTHNIPFNSSGSAVTGAYDYSGTIIQVFENGVELQYVNTNTTPTPVKSWKITAISNLGITSAPIPTPTANKWATIGNHNSMTANTATITYEIEACNSRGIIVSGLKANQTFAKNFNTSVYNILGAKTLVKFFDGSYSSVTVNAQKSEAGTTQIFGYLQYIAKNGTATVVTSNRELSTAGLTINIASSLTVTSVVVNLYETSTSTEILDTTELLVVPQGPRGQANTNWFYLTSGPYYAAEGDRIIADTRGGSFDVYLPPNPAKGAAVAIADGWDFTTYPLFVYGNGNIFVSQATKTVLELDVRNTTYEIVYSGNPLEGWNFNATAGPKGDEGDAAEIITLTASDTNFTFEDSTKSQPTTTTPIIITATKQNISGTVTFSAEAYNAFGSLLGPITLTNVTGYNPANADSPNKVQLTPTNFNSISGLSDLTTVRSVKITATLGTLVDYITIYRFDNGGDAITHEMPNENHSVQASAKGVVSSYTGASTTGRIIKGNVNETMNWTIGKTDDPTTGYTTTLTKPTRVSTKGTIGTITTIIGGWSATITNLDAGAAAQLAINDTISAIENSNGKLYGGTPTSVQVTGTNTITNTVTYKVIGGTTPVAGNIGGLAKGNNYYILTATNLADNIDSATTTITAVKDSQVSQKVFSLSKNKDGSFPITSDISNDNVNVETLSDGSGGSYSLANTLFTLLYGSVNLLAGDSKLTKIELIPSAGVTFNYTTRGIVSGGTITGGTTSSDFTGPSSGQPLIVTVSLTPAPINLMITVVNIHKDYNSGKVTIIATYDNVLYQQEFTVSKAKQGPDGTPAILYEVIANSEVIYNPNSETFSPSSVTYTAYTKQGANPPTEYKNTAGWIRLKHSVNNLAYTNLTDQQLTATSASRILNLADIPKTARFIRAELWLGDPSLTTSKLVDWEVDNITENGLKPLIITVDIINDNHTIPFNAAGIGTYTFSGTDIRVYENSTELQYVASGATLSSSQWKITAISGTNITAASIPAPTANKWAAVGDHSAMTSSTATVTYTISACNSKGEVFNNITDTQTFSRVNGNAVYRIIGATVVGRNKNGTYNNVTVNGQKNEGNTVTSGFGFLTQIIKTGTILGGESARTASSITTNPGTTGSPTAVVVRLYETASSTTILDEAEIKIVDAGTDGQGIDIVFTRHTSLPGTGNTSNPPAAAAGGSYTWYTNPASTIGSNPLYASTGRSSTPAVITSGWTWDTPVRVTGDIVVEISCFKRSSLASESAPTTGSYDFTTKVLSGLNNSWSSTIPTGTDPLWESRAFVTDVAPTTITWSSPVRVSISARAINIGGLGSVSYDPNTQVFSPTSLTLTAIPINLIGTPTYAWSTSSTGVSLSSTTGSSTIITFSSNTPKTITLTVTDAIGSISNSITVSIVASAVNNVVINYTNDTHAVPTNGGLNTWGGSGGIITVYDGVTPLTYTGINTTPPTTTGYALNITLISGNTTLTPGSLGVVGSTAPTLADWSGTLNTPTVYRITANVRTRANQTVSVSVDATLSPVNGTTSYWLSTTNSLSTTGSVWNTNQIISTIYKAEGTATPTLYSGRLVIDRLATNGSYVNIYTSNTNESSNTLNLNSLSISPSNTSGFRVQAYLAGGTTTKIDEEFIVVVKDGTPGLNAKGIDLNTAGGSFRKNTTTNVFNPANFTITATPQNFTPISYSWSVSAGGSMSNSNSASATLTPSGGATGSITVTVTATETNGTTYQKTVVFGIVTDGIGTDGKRTGTGYVYYQASTSQATTNVTAPSAASYQFTTGTFSGGNFPSTWSTTAPQYTPQNQQKYWAATYTCIEDTAGTNIATTSNIMFGTPTTVIGFTGLVAFTDIFSSGTTTIDGGKITSGSITADRIDTRGLTIKNSSGTVIFGAGTVLDWANISSSYPTGINNSNVTLSTLGYTGALNANRTTIDANGRIQGMTAGDGGNTLVDNSRMTLTKNSSNQLVFNNGSSSSNTISTGALAWISQITKAESGTYIAAGAIGNALIGNVIASSNFVSSGGVIDENAGTVSGGTAGWAIGKAGHAVFNSIDIRGNLTGGTITGQKVQVGADLQVSGSGHHGITLSETNGNWSNAFIRRQSDGRVYFNLNLGSTGGSISFNSGDGILNVNGNITCRTLTADRLITTGMVVNDSISSAGVENTIASYYYPETDPNYYNPIILSKTLYIAGLPTGEQAKIILILTGYMATSYVWAPSIPYELPVFTNFTIFNHDTGYDDPIFPMFRTELGTRREIFALTVVHYVGNGSYTVRLRMNSVRRGYVTFVPNLAWFVVKR